MCVVSLASCCSGNWVVLYVFVFKILVLHLSFVGGSLLILNPVPYLCLSLMERSQCVVKTDEYYGWRSPRQYRARTGDCSNPLNLNSLIQIFVYLNSCSNPYHCRKKEDFTTYSSSIHYRRTLYSKRKYN